MMAAVCVMSCSDTLVDDQDPNAPSSTDKGTGEIVMFTVGTTNASTTTRADGNASGITETPGKTYYMPDGGRFVCRMYYKANATSGGSDTDPYDVSGKTDVTTWLKVKGNVGNSLYWNREYRDVNEDLKGEGGVDDFGNDYDATAFYWQNRREHAFLAWTDFNRLTTIGYSPIKNSGELKFDPADEIYQKHTGEKREQWIVSGYQVNGTDQEFRTWAELRSYIETGSNYEAYIKNHKPDDADFTGQEYYYAYGWSCKFCREKDYAYTNVDEAHRKSGWTEYQMFYDKLPYEGETNGVNMEIKRDIKGVPAFLYDNASKKYLAQIDIKFYKLDGSGNITDQLYETAATDINAMLDEVLNKATVGDGDAIKKTKDGEVVAKCKYVYNLTDDYGNERYNETTPRYTFYYKDLEEKKQQEVIEEYQANVFDLTRKPVKDADGKITSYGINSITEQPDILRALTKQAPLGATQEANRVNLYFKHQFSQIQVNLKGSSDLSVVINKDDILKVELLGVTEKGYVFTEMDKDGKVEPSSYESVDVSKYTDAELAKNQYGTAFEMFDMKSSESPDDNYGYPSGYLKAYNAIAFGQLQAIRVTWTERTTDIVHESTFHVGNEQLKNLKSGCKYIWNIELRRGTLAIVRTEIVDWIVPATGLEYNTDGIIKN